MTAPLIHCAWGTGKSDATQAHPVRFGWLLEPDRSGVGKGVSIAVQSTPFVPIGAQFVLGRGVDQPLDDLPWLCEHMRSTRRPCLTLLEGPLYSQPQRQGVAAAKSDRTVQPKVEAVSGLPGSLGGFTNPYALSPETR